MEMIFRSKGFRPHRTWAGRSAVIRCQSAIRPDRTPDLDALDDRFESRILIGAIQIALAAVFVPIVLTILAAVGIFMIIEWCVLRVGAAIRGDSWPLREPMWWRLGRPDNELTAD
jgi:hypothetical protein